MVTPLQFRSSEVERAMKRLILLAASFALVTACTKSPDVQRNNLVSTATPSTKPAIPDPGPVATAGFVPSAAASPAAAAVLREVTIPAGTVLPVDLETPVGSDISRVEQPVHGHLRRAVTVRGAQVLPAGTGVSGYVTAARRPGKVQGRGYIAMKFTELEIPGEGKARITTAPVGRLAPATKEKDALEIIAPATAGAVIGR